MSSKKTITIVANDPSHPVDRGNRARLKAIVDQLIALGHDVHFILTNEGGVSETLCHFWGDRLHVIRKKKKKNSILAPFLRLAKTICRYFVRIFRGIQGARCEEWNPSNSDVDSYFHDEVIENVLHEIMQLSPDVVFLEYIFMSRLFEKLPDKILKVIDTHDVFTNRQYRLWEKGVCADWYSVSEADEAKAISRADYVVAIQEEEAKFFRSIAPSVHVVCVGHFQEERVVSLPGLDESIVLMVGSDNPDNQRGCEWFLDEVFPIVKERISNVRFQIVGKLKDAFDGIIYESVDFLGIVADLDELYDAAYVVVAPLLAGTGLKIKTVEALGHGKPVVATTAGALGLLNCSGDALVVKDNPVEFADALVAMLKDREGYAERCEKALELIRAMNRTNLLRLQSVLEK